MATKETHELLLELRKQLHETEFTKQEAKEKVLKLTELIDRAVDRGEADRVDHELNKHLQESVLYFEVSHPTLTATINTIINTLNAMGI
jgi:ATP-dependent exoDNAse (exonuclease V) alpha subunit